MWSVRNGAAGQLHELYTLVWLTVEPLRSRFLERHVYYMVDIYSTLHTTGLLIFLQSYDLSTSDFSTIGHSASGSRQADATFVALLHAHLGMDEHDLLKATEQLP